MSKIYRPTFFSWLVAILAFGFSVIVAFDIPPDWQVFKDIIVFRNDNKTYQHIWGVVGMLLAAGRIYVLQDLTLYDKMKRCIRLKSHQISRELRRTLKPAWKSKRIEWIIAKILLVLTAMGSIAEFSGISILSLIDPVKIPTVAQQLTVRVHLLGDRNNSISGDTVIVDAGDRRDVKVVGVNGEIDFDEIDGKYLDKRLLILYKSQKHQPAYKDTMYTFAAGVPVYLAVVPKCWFCKIDGYVYNNDRSLLPNVVVVIKDLQLIDTTDTYGYFKFDIPLDQQREQYNIAVLMDKLLFEDSVSMSEILPKDFVTEF